MKKIYFLFAFATFAVTSVKAQIYVTEAGGTVTKDGSSWSTAYDNTQLQQAINEASVASFKQVWVARGTYKPTESLSTTGFLTDGTTPVTDRDKAFILKTGVEIYGGFAGTETSLAERVNIATTNQTIFSGDLNNNSVADDGDSYHVVASRNASLNAVLDGFTIQHGFANGSNTITEGGEALSQASGGAIYIRGANTACKLANLIVRNNESTSFAAGVYLRGSGANKTYNFDGIAFEDNIGGGSGGALYIYFTSATTTVNINGCQFTNNSGKGDGGGAIITIGSAGTTNIENTNFTNNSHTLYGGAIRNGAGIMNIAKSIFKLNSSTRAAIYNTSSATINIDDSKFDQNSSSANGGQIYVYTGTLNVRRSVFANGTAATNGGAIFITSNGDGTSIVSSTATISNSIFYNNVAKLGGAIYLSYGSNSNSELSPTSLTLTNNTFYSNKCVDGTSISDAGGAIYFGNNAIATLNIKNCIFNKNVYAYDAVNQTGGISSDFRRGQTAAKQYYYNNLVQASTNLTDNGNRYAKDNINNANPSLLFQSTTPTDANFLYPISGSVVIDKGDNTLYGADLATATDILGNTRLVDGTNNSINDAAIDLGAIEWNSTLPVTFKSFTAALINNRTKLNWSVGLEDNVAKYIVERSVNGVDFVTIAEVQANGSKSYNAIDANPKLGLSYYRLTSVDNDGTTSTFGNIATVKVSTLNDNKFSVYPNPLKGNVLKIDLASYPVGNYIYQLKDITGAVLATGSINNKLGAINIDTQNVPVGIYVLTLTKGELSLTSKIIKH